MGGHWAPTQEQKTKSIQQKKFSHHITYKSRRLYYEVHHQPSIYFIFCKIEQEGEERRDRQCFVFATFIAKKSVVVVVSHIHIDRILPYTYIFEQPLCQGSTKKQKRMFVFPNRNSRVGVLGVIMLTILLSHKMASRMVVRAFTSSVVGSSNVLSTSSRRRPLVGVCVENDRNRNNAVGAAVSRLPSSSSSSSVPTHQYRVFTSRGVARVDEDLDAALDDLLGGPFSDEASMIDKLSGELKEEVEDDIEERPRQEKKVAVTVSEP